MIDLASRVRMQENLSAVPVILMDVCSIKNMGSMSTALDLCGSQPLICILQVKNRSTHQRELSLGTDVSLRFRIKFDSFEILHEYTMDVHSIW